MCHNLAEPFTETIVFTFDHVILLNQKLCPLIYFMYRGIASQPPRPSAVFSITDKHYDKLNASDLGFSND